MKFERRILRRDMIQCALCADAPCSKACSKLEPDRCLRSIWFDNESEAARLLPKTNPCISCSAPCESACVRPHEVPIQTLVNRLYEEVKPTLVEPIPESDDILRCDLCGIPLENPFLLSSSVVGNNYDMCARAFEAGWAGVAYKTICNFEIHEASPRYAAITGDNGTMIGFKNVEQLSVHSVKENLEVFRKLKEHYPTKLVLASIMGRNEAEWEELARLCDEYGADAIELNFSCPNMMEEGLGSDIGAIPELVEQYTRAARRGTSKPILAKLTPNVESMSEAATAAKRGGADGIAAINTIKSVMNINPYTYLSDPAVHGMSAVGGYSGNAVKPIALRFITELGQNEELKGMHISGMGGIESWKDALEFILTGSASVQVTTAVMQYGQRIIDDLKSGLKEYLYLSGYKSIKDVVGAALETIGENTDVLERDTVIYPKFLSDRCIGCGRCMISCSDGGHQAIKMNENRRPVMNPSRCVGCHLCVLVCPNNAIRSSGKRVALQSQNS